jgi:large subunit ribosomal protein L13
MAKKNYQGKFKTFNEKNETVKRNWVLVDAKDQVLGRLSTKIAMILRGKNKAIFTPHVDTGDFVIVINAAKVKVTGNKGPQKTYYSHSGYPGGLKEIVFDKLIISHPEEVIRLAVKRMMPRSNLSHQQMTKLKIFPGESHSHTSQKPEMVKLETR